MWTLNKIADEIKNKKTISAIHKLWGKSGGIIADYETITTRYCRTTITDYH